MPKGSTGESSKFYVGVMTGLFTKRHADIIADAVYLYGYLLSKVTAWNKELRVGGVLAGSPVKFSFIENETGFPARTIRRHVKKLEDNGYIFTLRSPRGLKYFITNYRPAGKPRLKTSDLPHLATLRLSQLASQGVLSGQQVATCEGININGIKTGAPGLKNTFENPFTPLYDIYLLLNNLFDVTPGTAELRFFFRGYKKHSDFCDMELFIKAVARALMSHRNKMAKEESAGKKPRGITNIVAYLNSGLHGSRRFLRQTRFGEEPFIDEVVHLHTQLLTTIKNQQELYHDNIKI